MRVQNESGKPQPAADQYAIKDTQGTIFRPITMGKDNLYAYRGGTVRPAPADPGARHAAASSTIQGSLLLFKIPVKNFENRPLESNRSSIRTTASVDSTLEVPASRGRAAIVRCDV